MPATIVRVKNLSDKNLKVNVGPDIYDIPSDGDAIVPYEYAAAWFGDPRVMDNPPKDWARKDYYKRKRAQWSFALGFDVETIAEAVRFGKEPTDSWEYKAPKFEVWTVDGTPQRIYMVLEDPSGALASGVTGSPGDAAPPLESADVKTLKAMIEAQNEQVQFLMQELARRSELTVPGTSESEQVDHSPQVAPAPGDPITDNSTRPIPEAPADSGRARKDTPRQVSQK